MAHRFIVGETPAAALGTIGSQWKDGVATSLDLLGEATVTQAEADRYAARCREALETVSVAATRWPPRPVLEQDSVGPLPRVNVSVKVSALTPLMRPEAPAVGRDDAARRLRPLLRLARDLNAHLHVDMESLDTLEATTELFFELLDEEEFRNGPSAGLVLQAYLRESPAQLDRLLDWARATGRTPPLVIRLVKGAYWDHEIVEARQHGWTPPVFEVKADCDRNFERLTARLVEARPAVRVAIALAQPALGGVCDRGEPRRRGRGSRPRAPGPARPGRRARAGAGRARMRVRSYCPVGDLVAGMAYLVRRLLENTSNESFLQNWREGADARGAARRSVSLPPFANEPVLELRRAPVRDSLLEALRELDARLPLRVPVLIGGSQGADTGFESTDPGAPSRVVAHAGRATESDAAAAVEAAARGYRDWAARPAAERAEVLRGAAAWLRERRLELAALQVRECAKPWGEADADVCEAIDFLEYYARAGIELERGRELLQVPGERNTMRYAPRGVVAVISPWNFPLAIPTGMVAAGLAAGNAVVLKPAEQSPGSALMLVEALHAAGVPPDALSLLPGFGDAGAALVRDPRVHVIAFTGSSAVGLEIVREAAETPEGQDHVKRVVAEMGGKNCVIVDSDADLDEVVPGVVQSAFVYAGQKCSAAARVLVHDAVHDALVERLAGATEAMIVGQAEDFTTEVPPVIEREARDRVERYARAAREQGRLAGEAAVVPDGGWFCPPRVACGLPDDSPVLREEIFGPLLAVSRVGSMEEACDVVDSLPFALTGGLFSRSPQIVEYVSRRTPVGNLYVNRGITGAMVARQPFGGNKRSGIGSKAGGPDYLLQFAEPRVMTENTMRHGLVVE